MKNPKISATVEKSIYDAIHDLAVHKGMAMSTVVRDLIEQGLESRKRHKKEAEKIGRDRKYQVKVQNRSYEVILHPDLEDGGFWIECPSIPGCASQGETVEESLEMIKEAIAGCLDVLEEDKRSVCA